MYLEIFFKSLILGYPFIVKSFPGGTVVKNLPANAGDKRDAGLFPGLKRSLGGGNGRL